MALRTETRIFEALMERLSSLVLSPAVAVAWPDVDFEPAGRDYLAPSWMPAETTGFGVEDSTTEQHVGILQVSAFTAEDDRGLTSRLEQAGAVADHFPKGLVLQREGVVVRITDVPRIGAPLMEPGWYQLPVTIPWRSFN